MPTVDVQNMLQRFVEEDTVLRAYVAAATGGQTHDAQDILQTVWQVLWQKIEVYDKSRPLRAWAMGIARVEVLKWRQRQARRREYLSENVLELLAEAAVEEGATLDLRAELLDLCFKEVPPHWRRVLGLKYHSGLSIQQIATRLSRSVAAVEMILVRARRALRACVERKFRAAKAAG
jgi:RNA polymerase sigma-70 factor (ECF subfamily)